MGVRLRPLLPSERARGAHSCVQIEQNRVVLSDPQRSGLARAFECGFAFDSSDSGAPNYADQKAIYDRIGADIVEQGANGFNCCLCAYGQTGTGKTFTIHGDWAQRAQWGLLPRMAEGLSWRIAELRAKGAVVRTHVSYLEVYNDQLRDLLAVTQEAEVIQKETERRRSRLNVPVDKLEIHTHPVIGVYVDNLTELPVMDFQDIQRIIAAGERCKNVAATSMNGRSSRSHTIFCIKLEIKEAITEDARMASVKVVDLAGRENEQTSECAGDRFRELTSINGSLFQLANCINALTDGATNHVPFRNSKLTMLLSESFQRNSRTYLLATLTPSAAGYDENLLTCRFLESAGRVTTEPLVNQFSSEVLCGRLQDEIERLQRELGLGIICSPMPSSDAGEPLSARRTLLRRIQEQVAQYQGLSPGHEALQADASGGHDGRHAIRKMTGARSAGKLQLQPIAPEVIHAIASSFCRDAVGQVGKVLGNAEESLDRLDQVNADSHKALDEAEDRLSALESSMQELLGRRSNREPQYVEKPNLETRASQKLMLPPVHQHRVPSPAAHKHEKALPGVTFSITLPSITILE